MYCHYRRAPNPIMAIDTEGRSLQNAVKHSEKPSHDNPARSLLLLCGLYEDEKGSQHYRNSLIPISYRNSNRHLQNTHLRCMHTKQTAQSKSSVEVSSVNGQQKTKDFFSSPTLCLSSLRIQLCHGWRKSPFCSE